MRLLNSKSYQLESLSCPAPNAIVSHRWGEESEEVLFTDIASKALRRTRRLKCKGYDKIQGACNQAMQDGINHVWLDTCCIDRSNSTELSEAINSMHKWYQQSHVCYVYLHDVSDLSEFTKSDWFTRGWTLQELIAPMKIKFFTKNWRFFGTREDLVDPISEITGISHAILRSGKIPHDVSVSQKMCWAAKRRTTKVEDRAYSLLGILGVNMPSIYGIDGVAFEDLQHKIITKSDDQTLFSWYHAYMPAEYGKTEDVVDSVSGLIGDDDNTPPFNATGLLASSPSHYLKSYEIPAEDFRKNYVDRIREFTYRSRFSIDNNYILIPLPVKHMVGKVWKAVLRCSFEPPNGHERQRPLVIYLRELDHLRYVRVHLQVGPNEWEEKGEDGIQIHGIPGVPGSLDRLSDAELQLQGYVLREIDVLARYGDSRTDDPWLGRQLRSVPPSPHAITESRRITQFPRQQLHTRTTNVPVGIDIGERVYVPQISGEAEIAKSESKGEPPSRMKSGLQDARIPEGSHIRSMLKNLNLVRSTFERSDDLTGHVTRSEHIPFALGLGGFGDVYRGSLNLNEESIQVAIKACRVYYLDHDGHLDDMIRTFHREIMVWLKLDHPNVLPLYGTIRDPCLHPKIPAMICPWVENGTLTEYLEKNVGLSISRRLDLVNDVAQGLNYLHSQLVVHGDLSGSSVLVHADGNACVSDFGLFTLLAPIPPTNPRNQDGLRWIAPELLSLSDSQVMPTMQSDVYSFACIVLQTLTGRIPYHYFAHLTPVICAIVRGEKPRRPDQTAVTENRWSLMEWCWSPAKLRPSSNQIAEFTGRELAELLGVGASGLQVE